VATGFAGVSLAATAQPALAPEELFEKLVPSVWTIEVFDAANRPMGLGSGVVVAPGSVVTNCHVLAKSSRVAVTRENVSYGAVLEHPDPERDLCLLRVRNLRAPPVAMGDAESLKIGARVYAIGSPRGLEQTLSDGLVSGVRRSERGELQAVQISVPISPGSSGGGLFDGQGRLVGITTSGLRDSQNLNFAMPANWIAEVPERAKALLAARTGSKTTAAHGPAVVITPPAAGRPRVFEYSLVDRITGNENRVVYRLERQDGDQLIFNQGSRVERADGSVVRNTAAIGGEFDLAMPQGGWVRAGVQRGSAWRLDYDVRESDGGRPIRMQLDAEAVGEGTMSLKGQDVRIVHVRFTGFTLRGINSGNLGSGRYVAQAWFAPDLGRIVQFDVRTRGGIVGGASFLIDEQLKLVDIRDE
jgi:S1-C subfamily serine protease